MPSRVLANLSGVNVVLCGPLCAGKTTLAAGLERRGLTPVSAIDAIETLAGRRGLTRAELQRLGRELERSSPGRWLAEAAARTTGPVVLDAARTERQVTASRALLAAVVVHLTAPEDARRYRFERRRPVRRSDAAACFDELAASPLERGADELGLIADILIDTERLSPRATLDALLDRIAEFR